jgi:hypothetical protein
VASCSFSVTRCIFSARTTRGPDDIFEWLCRLEASSVIWLLYWKECLLLELRWWKWEEKHIFDLWHIRPSSSSSPSYDLWHIHRFRPMSISMISHSIKGMKEEVRRTRSPKIQIKVDQSTLNRRQGPTKALFGCKCIHLNPRRLECNGMKFSSIHSNPLQHTWIKMNICASKQALKDIGYAHVWMIIFERDQC